MLPHCSHIARKRGVYYFRRRLPRPARGEIAVSLGTRCFREAQHLAELLDRGFTRIAKAHVDDVELQNILGAYLRARLAEDRQRYLETPSGRPVYGSGYGDHDDPSDADLEALDIQLDLEREALARRDLHPVRDDIAELAERHRVPAHRHVAAVVASCPHVEAVADMLLREEQRRMRSLADAMGSVTEAPDS